MSFDPNLLELDLDNAPKAAAPDTLQGTAPELDLIDNPADPVCIGCAEHAPVNDRGYCKFCHEAGTVAAEPAPESVQEAATDFADIAANAAANANAHNLGEDANGRANLGVGFHNARGYIEALKRGVAAATLREYAETLRSRYSKVVDVTVEGTSYTVKIAGEGEFTAPLMTVVAGNGEYGTDSGVNDAAIAAIKARAAMVKAGQAKVAAQAQGLEIVAPAAGETVAPVRALQHGDLVAGAVAEGHGILTHWAGSGTLTGGKIAEILAAAGAPADWAPKAKESRTQANLAVTKVANEAGLIVHKQKRDWRKKDQAYDARWTLSTPAAGAVAGEAAGTVVVAVTLNEDELKFDIESEVSEQIAAEFATLKANEVFQAGHVTSWLGSVFRDRLGGVKYGGSWYVPRESREAAEKLVDAFEAAKWGSDWVNPPLPVATSSQLSKGIARGLAAEVDETLTQLKIDSAACKNGKVGEKAATTYLAKFKDHAARALHFGAILGESEVASCKAKIAAAVTELEGALDGTALRFARLWEEVEDDAVREAKKGQALDAEAVS